MKCCGSCKWAGWEGALTPTGRFKRDACGRCKYPTPALPKLPWATQWALRNNPNPFAVKTGIGPESGSECEVYEKAEIHPSTKGLVDTMKVG